MGLIIFFLSFMENLKLHKNKREYNNELLCNHHSTSVVIKFYHSSFSCHRPLSFPGGFSSKSPKLCPLTKTSSVHISLIEMNIFSSHHAIITISKLTVVNILTIIFIFQLLQLSQRCLFAVGSKPDPN